jgi:OOP family OmpA-OmpF porin
MTHRFNLKLTGAAVAFALAALAGTAPTPLVVAPPPQPPVIEQISLSSDVLFAFDKAELKPEGMKKIDDIAGRLKGANVQVVNAIGHADRIGPDKYNQQLSEKRAEAVKEYLAQKGVETSKVRSEGRGKSDPVTGDQCKGMSGSKLISCLQPDRRVDIEVRGEKETASTSTSPSAGSTSGSGSLSAPGGASSGASPASGSSSSGSTK